jgi:hypothetical protein
VAHDHAHDAGEIDAVATAPPHKSTATHGGSVPAWLLQRQKAAGNRAVSGFVSRIAVQRHAPGPADGPARPIGEGAVKQIVDQGVIAGAAGVQGAQNAPPPPAAGAGVAAPTAEAPAKQGGLFSGLLSGVGSAIKRGIKAVGSAIASVGTAISTAVRRQQAKGKITVDVQAHGAPGTSKAKAYVDEVFMGASLANLEAMAGKTIEFHIIPVGTKLTELDPFKDLAGTQTFDGRMWDDVRGIWMGAGDKTIRFAVGAEDLGANGSGYGDGFVAAHEGGHGLQFHGLTATQSAAITKAYTEKVAAHPVTQATPATDAAQAFWLQPEWYSAANENEYFASSVAAWFGHPYANSDESKKRYTKSWLKENDKAMYDILKGIYG